MLYSKPKSTNTTLFFKSKILLILAEKATKLQPSDKKTSQDTNDIMDLMKWGNQDISDGSNKFEKELSQLDPKTSGIDLL